MSRQGRSALFHNPFAPCSRDRRKCAISLLFSFCSYHARVPPASENCVPARGLAAEWRGAVVRGEGLLGTSLRCNISGWHNAPVLPTFHSSCLRHKIDSPCCRGRWCCLVPADVASLTIYLKNPPRAAVWRGGGS